jgi:Bacterial PH domain
MAHSFLVAGGQQTQGPVLSYRPHTVRVVCWVLAIVVVIFFAVVATLLTGPTDSGKGVFETSDQIAMIVLGVLGALAILAFTRPRVTADADRVKIRNVIGGYDLPWGVVRAVRFDRGNPWVTLELEDDDVVAVMAIQAVDKDSAVAAARTLRTLLNQSRG